MTEHPLGQPQLYDAVGSLIAYEDGEGTLGVIVENAWQRHWTHERSLSLVVWNNGSVSHLNREHQGQLDRRVKRTTILLQQD